MATDVLLVDPQTDEVDREWNGLLARSPWSTPFSTLPFLRSYARATGRTAELVILREDGEVKGGLPLIVRKTGPLRLAEPPPLVPFVTPLLDPIPSEADLHRGRGPWTELLPWLSGRYDYLDLRLPPQLTDVRPLTWQQWQCSPLYTYLLHGGTREAVLGRSSSSVRRRWRKYRDEHEITTGTPAELLSQMETSFARQDRPLPLPPQVLERLFASLASSGEELFEIRCIRRKQAPVGAVGLLHGSDRSYYFCGGSTPGPAMTLLLLDAAIDTDHPIDLVGANTPSIAEFKRTLGADLIRYSRAESPPSPLARLARTIRRWIR